jgi:hypothetical protein
MGIRVHKLLGYGLTDVKTDETTGHRITDARINSNSSALNWEAPSISEYREWLEARSKTGDIETDVELSMLLRPEPNERGLDLEDAVTHNGEFGLPNVLVISPPTFRSWSRFDDMIDWIEESYLRNPTEPQTNRVEALRHGIYPFIGYMDSRTGEKVDDVIFNWIRATNPEARRPFNGPELDILAQAAGFEDNGDAWANVAPIVPNDVKNIAQFLMLFTDDSVLLQLRPVLYTYWS